jgi:2-dehydropantoate 2-reductase
MRVAILGMGAIGHLVARALDGRADVVAVDRTRAPVREGERNVDVALVTTKTPGTLWAAEVAAALLDPDGVALTIQNGLGNYETLVRRLGRERVALGVIYVGAALRADGSLFSTGPGAIEAARPAADGPSRRFDELAALLRAGGMRVSVVTDPWPSVWRKLVANAAMNPTTALFGCTNAELLAHPAGAPLADELARETARVASGAGVAIGEDEAVAMWRRIGETLGANRSSMLQDVAAGRPTEIDAINGAVASEGERRGVPAPVNRAMTLLVAALGEPRGESATAEPAAAG